MTAARKLKLISIEEYLAGELESPIKYEYLGGFVYAMAGARNLHNLIKGSIFAAAFHRLRGQRCRPWNSDTKIRIQLPGHTRFYYPDDSIVCDPNPANDSFCFASVESGRLLRSG
jgi:Uma2 family endonuclease